MRCSTRQSWVHPVAAEPLATFLHIAVADGRHEVAYDVLGRLRRGFRIFQLRSPLNCSSGPPAVADEANLRVSPRHLRLMNRARRRREEATRAKQDLAELMLSKRAVLKQRHQCESPG